MTDAPTLRIQLLGAFRVAVGDRLVPEDAWRSRRAAAIVKLLALAPGHCLHREQAMDALWSALDPDAQTNNLNVAVSRARRALAAAGAPPGAFLTREGALLRFGPLESIEVDVTAFEEGVAESLRSRDPAVLRGALARYAGDLLPGDAYEDWLEDRRAALRAGYVTLLTRLGQLHAEWGEIDEAITAYRRLVAAEPAQEESHVALIRLYAGIGRRAEALAQYDRLVAVLKRDIDAAPDRATTELARAIRDGRYLEATTCRVAVPPSGRAAGCAPSSNMPAPISDLVGRERELAGVHQRLAAGRLVTLTGPGGIGKTRLAIAVAGEAAGAFTDGAFFVDLSPIRDPALVALAVAEALDVREQGGRPLLDALKGELRDRHLLLVLDNFEHLIGAAPVVAALLEAAPRLVALVTSRVPLRLRGEQEYPVPPLALPDPDRPGAGGEIVDSPAVALFLRRARDVRPDFAVTDENAPALVEVCRRLDGLPLAIELAAARAKLLSPQAMLSRLDRPLAFLVGGSRDLPHRQQTIRDAIAWSHSLLNVDEQRLFRRLAVFVGGWTLEAAEAVAAPLAALPQGAACGIDTFDGLASLVDKSLVVQREPLDRALGDVSRFGMLETIREFGLERLAEADEETAVRDRHAAYYLALAEAAEPHLEAADQARWLDRLAREDGNLRAALEWVAVRGQAEAGLRLVMALRMYWFIRGQVAYGCDQLLAAVALPGSAAFPGLCADVLNAVGLLIRDSDVPLARDASTRSLALSREANDLKRGADALANLGYIALGRGDFAGADALSQDCLAINRGLGNRQGIADALSILALAAHYRGDVETARRLMNEALAIWLDLDDRQGIVWARTRLGGVLVRQKALDAAFFEFRQSLAIARALDFRWGLSWSLDGLAQLAAAAAAPHVALPLAAAAVAVRDASGLRLTDTEQADVDRLLDALRAQLGWATVADALSRQERWSLDELEQTIADELGNVLAGIAARRPVGEAR